MIEKVCRMAYHKGMSGNSNIFNFAGSDEKPTKSLNPKFLLGGIVVVILIVLGMGSGIYYYVQYQNVKNVLGSKASSTADPSAELIKKVGMLIELPKRENPAIATVSDITKLKGQPFFAHAKNGDKVLIYQKSQKAILYDPLVNKVVKVQGINISSAGQNTASPSASESRPVRMALLNGTNTSGLATATEKTLTAAFKNVTVVSKGTATALYTKTLVVDLTGKSASVSSQIAFLLKGEVGKLPAGEVKPVNADILVILGKQP
jgi:hypothetical protein